jgi:DNA-binding transcriptional LysR family regulator
MDRLDAMGIFVSIVDEGSLAAAARRLRRSPVAVTRALALLEREAGATLLARSTRAMRLTPAGERYLRACRNVMAELASAEESVGSEQLDLRGQLAVTAPATLGRLHVRPALDGFLDAHPGVAARLLLIDRVVNLVEEGFDAAIRIGHLPDSSLVAVKLGEVRRIACASPVYLASHPPLQRPADLAQHDCILFSQGAADEGWRFVDPSGRTQRPINLRRRLSLNDAVAAVTSAAAGHGVTRILSYQAEAELRSGRLVRLLKDFEPAPLPVHLLHASQRPATARLRAFIDYAAPVLRDALARIETAIAAQGEAIRRQKSRLGA